MTDKTPHVVVSQPEAEYARGQAELEQLCERFGFDTTLMWWWTARLKLRPDDARPLLPSPGTIHDPRR